MNELILSKELEGVEASKAEQIEAVFAPMVEMLKGFESRYDEVMGLEYSEQQVSLAKNLRRDIAKVRISADKVRKEQKAEYLRAGNAIQGVYNILKFAVVEKEEALKEIEETEKRIAEQKAREEEERRSALQEERLEILEQYGMDATMVDLGGMEPSVWMMYHAGVKADYERAKKAEKMAEIKRLEEEAKRKAAEKKMREENARLQRQAEKLRKEKAEEERKAKELERTLRSQETKAKEAIRREEIRLEEEKRKARNLEERMKEYEKPVPVREPGTHAESYDRAVVAGWLEQMRNQVFSTEKIKVAVRESIKIFEVCLEGDGQHQAPF